MFNSDMGAFKSTMTNTPKANVDPSSPEFQRANEEKRRELKDKGLEGDELEAEIEKWINSQKGSTSTPGPSCSQRERNRREYEKKIKELKAKGVTGEELEAALMDTDYFREFEASVDVDFLRVMNGKFEKEEGDGFVAWTRKWVGGQGKVYIDGVLFRRITQHKLCKPD